MIGNVKRKVRDATVKFKNIHTLGSVRFKVMF